MKKVLNEPSKKERVEEGHEGNRRAEGKDLRGEGGEE